MKKIALSVWVILLSACASTEEKKPDYIPPEEAALLNRSTQDKAKTLTDLGLAYYKLGRYESAQASLDKSLLIDAKNAMTYQVMALIYVRRGIADKAEANFKKAMQLAPDDFNILTDYAVFLFEQKRKEQALATFKSIIDAPFYKNKWVAYYYLGQYDLKNKAKKAAEIKFYKALKLNPSYAPCLLEMAKIRYQKQSWMSARAFIERYLGAAGHTLAGLEWAIKIEQALGDQRMAEQYELRLMRDYPFSDYAEQLKRH